jgi:hypothetical protein
MLEMVATHNVSNDGADDISTEEPYRAMVELTGKSDMLFHAWSNEAVAEKAKAKKNSAAKKTDNIESYVYRMPNKNLAIPGSYLKGSIVNAARWKQDPRSPRKSAMDLYRAGILMLTTYADLGVDKWDYLDKSRVTVQRAAITRTRPAMLAGWKAIFEVMVQTPEYISRADLHDVISNAGKLVGLADNRPSYGRFFISKFEVIQD